VTLDESEESPRPPTPTRVAARALVLSAVACRGLIERDASKPGAEQLRKDVRQWLSDIGVAAEMEEREAAMLSTPLGKLDRQAAIDASWSSEGLVVLGWALGRAPLPAFYAECDSPEVANALGFLAEKEDTVLKDARLRDQADVSSAEETYLTLHWRLRQFSLDSKPMDFAEYVARCNWGPLRLDDVPLCDGDLAVDGVRIDRVPDDIFHQTVSIVQERHRAFNWLMGWDSVYSQVTTDT
jgi:uncharacterized protein DUF4272